MGAFFAFIVLIFIFGLILTAVSNQSGKPVKTTSVINQADCEPSSEQLSVASQIVAESPLEPIVDEKESDEEEVVDSVWHRTIKVRGTTFRDGIDNLWQEYHEAMGDEPYNGLTSKEIREELREFGGSLHEFAEFETTNFELVPEPDNPVDPNAIKVVVEGYFIGYVSSGYAKQLKKYIYNAMYEIGGIAKVYGGNYKYWGGTRVQNQKNNVGCKIDLIVKKVSF